MQLNERIFIGNQIIRLTETHSTNNYAKDMLSKSKPIEGTAILADFQSSGRGYSNNVWQSQNGKNILASIILYPNFFSIQYQFVMNKVICLGIMDALQGFLPKAQVEIKWPNDIYVNHKKIGGILIENSFQGSLWQSAVVGFGININQILFEGLAGYATSLAMINKHDHNLDQVLESIFKHIEVWYLRMKTSNIALIDSRYLENLYLLNLPSTFKSENDEDFQGTIIGVSPEGQLQIESNGKVKLFRFKEVKFLL